MLAANLAILVIVVAALAFLLLPRISPVFGPLVGPAANLTVTPTLSGNNAIFAPTPTAEPTLTPLPPTVNPTQLVALPNQGRNDAPPAPPGSTSTRAVPTLTATKSIATPSVTPKR